MKRPGTTKNGKINTDTGSAKIVTVNARTISATKMKIIIIAKTLLASVKMAPLNKNSWNLDKYFSETILSITYAKSFIILNFIN